MDSRAKELIAQGDNLFTKKQPLLSLWQEINDNFYPERADYTLTRTLGMSFADNLVTSYPILARRELDFHCLGTIKCNLFFTTSITPKE